MNSLNSAELKAFVQEYSPQIEGAQLQEIWLHNELLFLEFYLKGSFWLAVDLKLLTPQILVLKNRPPQMSKEKKPLVLFLQSNAKNLRIKNLFVEENFGRVVGLDLGSCQIRIILIPHATNILVEAGSKKISWSKPKELKEATVETSASAIDWEARTELWLSEKFKVAQKSSDENAGVQKIKKAIEKKTNALAALEDQLKKNPAKEWRELGEALKTGEELASNLKKLLDSKKSKSGNIEHSFEKAKQLERKLQGTKDRLGILKNEISKLEHSLLNPATVVSPKVSIAAQMMRKHEVTGRKMDLGEGIEAVMGKSGEDNLSLLRHSRAWDLWVHLKDYPGAYAILMRQKNQSISDAQIEQVSQWLIQQFLSKKSAIGGGKYDVVVTECRFVRPVKGAKKGLVTYQNARALTIAAKA